jgi:hypothetical protein
MTQQPTFTTWRKAHRSDPADNCVQIAFATDHSTVGVRDSKNPTGPMLAFSPTAWAAFTEAIRTVDLQP